MDSIKSKLSITEEDQNMLNQLQEIIKTFHPKYSHFYFGDPELYFHKDHGYVYTIDDRPLDGTLKWYSKSGKLLYTSINFIHEKKIDKKASEKNDELVWLENIEKITKVKNNAATMLPFEPNYSYSKVIQSVEEDFDFC